MKWYWHLKEGWHKIEENLQELKKAGLLLPFSYTQNLFANRGLRWVCRLCRRWGWRSLVLRLIHSLCCRFRSCRFGLAFAFRSCRCFYFRFCRRSAAKECDDLITELLVVGLALC